MDIAALSIAMSQSRVKEAVGISVMKMAMNTGSELSNQMTKMIEDSSVDPNLGSSLDVRA